jgi:hypothetical protein
MLYSGIVLHTHGHAIEILKFSLSNSQFLIEPQKPGQIPLPGHTPPSKKILVDFLSHILNITKIGIFYIIVISVSSSCNTKTAKLNF